MKKNLRALLALPAMLLVLLLTTAACGLGSSGDSSAGGDAAAVSDESASQDKSATPEGSANRQSSDTSALSRAVISTGQISLRAESLGRARAQVMGLVSGWRGLVSDEQTNSDERGRVAESTLTLRVPTASFDEAMAALAKIGKVEQQSRKTEDVTTQVIDNSTRVSAAERSIRQIELLLDRAKDLGDIIKIEADLARRQADLDSLKAQQAWLRDQTTMSTITVYLSASGVLGPPEEARGFLAGLESGWNSLKAATVLLLTAVGAVLPFSVTLLLLGVPLWLVVRRRRTLRVAAPAVAPAD